MPRPMQMDKPSEPLGAALFVFQASKLPLEGPDQLPQIHTGPKHKRPALPNRTPYLPYFSPGVQIPS